MEMFESKIWHVTMFGLDLFGFRVYHDFSLRVSEGANCTKRVSEASTDMPRAREARNLEI